jgi:outer membrane protein TolC
MGKRTLSMKTIFTFVLILLQVAVFAQDTLTLDRAIQMAIDNNPDIGIFRNQKQAAANSAHPGNAGLLPSVQLNSSYNYNINDTELEFANNIPPNDIQGAESRAVNASIQANYTLFDGLGTIYTYQQLKNSAVIADVEARMNTENILLQVISAYYEVARLEDQYVIARENLAISKDRLARAKNGYDLGNTSKLNLLNAEVDFNRDSISSVQALQLYENGIRTLNFVLGVDIDTEYAVSVGEILPRTFIIEELWQGALENNAMLLTAAYNQQQAELEVKRVKSDRMPVLNLTAGYGYTQNQNDAGILLQSQNLGFNAGLSLQWAIFNGSRTHIQIRNAQIAIETNDLVRKKAELQIERDIKNVYANYENTLRIIELEKLNVKTSELNFERTEEQYRLGRVTNTQYREAQRNLAQSRLNLSNAYYQYKLAEIELLRLSGQLLN